MSLLLLYLIQITVVAVIAGIAHKLAQKHFMKQARWVLSLGLICVLFVSVSAVLPDYQILSIPGATSAELGATGPAENPIEPTMTGRWMPAVLLLFAALALWQLISFLGGILSIYKLTGRAREILDERLQATCRQLCAIDSGYEIPLSRTRFRVTNEIRGAATVGVFQPTVLLPAHWHQWQPQHLQSVLAHELQHVSRSDFLFRACTELIRVLHFYHPCVNWLVRQFRLEQEFHADLAAVRLTDPIDYESFLLSETLRKSRARKTGLAPTFTGKSRSMLRKRIELLRSRDTSPNRRSAQAGLLSSLLLILTFVVCGVQVNATSSPLGAGDDLRAKADTSSSIAHSDERDENNHHIYISESYLIVGSGDNPAADWNNVTGDNEVINKVFDFKFGLPGKSKGD